MREAFADAACPVHGQSRRLDVDILLAQLSGTHLTLRGCQQSYQRPHKQDLRFSAKKSLPTPFYSTPELAFNEGTTTAPMTPQITTTATAKRDEHLIIVSPSKWLRVRFSLSDKSHCHILSFHIAHRLYNLTMGTWTGRLTSLGNHGFTFN